MDIPTLLDDLERDEGLRLKVYADSKGIPTIGIGRNLRDVGISRAEAFTLLNNDVNTVLADLDVHLPWWRRLDDPRQRVMANMCFNLGIAGLMKFTTTLGLIQSGDYGQAASHMLTLPWAAQVGLRAQRLAALMREGLTPADDGHTGGTP